MAATSTSTAKHATAKQPVIQRPRPAHGLELAEAIFLAGERVEMGLLAARLDISQATIYRWFGSREQLLEQVIARIAGRFIAAARQQAQGEGDERVLDFVRRFMEVTATLEPVRAFVAREPQLALRLLLGESGVVRQTLHEALAQIIADTRTPEQARELEPEIDVLVEVGVALEWATFAIGDKPQVEHAIHIMRAMLAAHAAGMRRRPRVGAGS